jgi:hypothetical protein
MLQQFLFEAEVQRFFLLLWLLELCALYLGDHVGMQALGPSEFYLGDRSLSDSAAGCMEIMFVKPFRFHFHLPSKTPGN